MKLPPKIMDRKVRSEHQVCYLYLHDPLLQWFTCQKLYIASVWINKYILYCLAAKNVTELKISGHCFSSKSNKIGIAKHIQCIMYFFVTNNPSSVQHWFLVWKSKLPVTWGFDSSKNLLCTRPCCNAEMGWTHF